MKITVFGGTRPNFIKIAPLIDAMRDAEKEGKKISWRLIHTGQHYDHALSRRFFEELGIPEPDANFETGSGTHAEQTAQIMVKTEKELMANRPDVVVVAGDVNSTAACALAAKKLTIDVAHIEAGIRSFDRTMPEEINRLVTDSITDHFFTTSSFADHNLKKEGIPAEKIHFVGNIMIDTLLKNKSRFAEPEIFRAQSLLGKKYIVLTLHRPSNVDDPQHLVRILKTISYAAGDSPVIFPVHPRTQKSMEANSKQHFSNIHFTSAMGYLEFLYLVEKSAGVITDSGGIQEETTVLHVPCITLRTSTERPETITEGTNELIGEDPDVIPLYIEKILSGNWKTGKTPPLWDGKTAERIVSVLYSYYEDRH